MEDPLHEAVSSIEPTSNVRVAAKLFCKDCKDPKVFFRHPSSKLTFAKVPRSVRRVDLWIAFQSELEGGHFAQWTPAIVFWGCLQSKHGRGPVAESSADSDLWRCIQPELRSFACVYHFIVESPS